MISHSLYRLMLFLSGLIILSGCTQERNPCLQPVTAFTRLGCYQWVPSDTGLVARDTLLPYVHLGALDNDSLKFLYFGTKQQSKFSILLSPILDSCRWLLQTDSVTTSLDTITFYYDRSLQFISGACGYTHFYTLREISWTRHQIDSVYIANPTIDLDVNSGEHVQIFF